MVEIEALVCVVATINPKCFCWYIFRALVRKFTVPVVRNALWPIPRYLGHLCRVKLPRSSVRSLRWRRNEKLNYVLRLKIPPRISRGRPTPSGYLCDRGTLHEPPTKCTFHLVAPPMEKCEREVRERKFVARALTFLGSMSCFYFWCLFCVISPFRKKDLGGGKRRSRITVTANICSQEYTPDGGIFIVRRWKCIFVFFFGQEERDLTFDCGCISHPWEKQEERMLSRTFFYVVRDKITVLLTWCTFFSAMEKSSLDARGKKTHCSKDHNIPFLKYIKN